MRFFNWVFGEVQLLFVMECLGFLCENGGMSPQQFWDAYVGLVWENHGEGVVEGGLRRCIFVGIGGMILGIVICYYCFYDGDAFVFSFSG